MGSSGFEDLGEAIGDLQDDLRDNVEDSVDASLNAMKRSARINLANNDSTYTGATANSLAVEATREHPEGFYKKLTVGGPSAPQATSLEFGSGDYFGRSPYEVPARQSPIPSPRYLSSGMAANIRHWMDAKGVHDPDIDDKRLSWMIASSIVEEGSPGQPFFRPAYFQQEKYSVTRAKLAVKNSVRDV